MEFWSLDASVSAAETNGALPNPLTRHLPSRLQNRVRRKVGILAGTPTDELERQHAMPRPVPQLNDSRSLMRNSVRVSRKVLILVVSNCSARGLTADWLAGIALVFTVLQLHRLKSGSHIECTPAAFPAHQPTVTHSVTPTG
jgi:hypothetical protein